jgi:uncharacterized damage-inducible protein DinB
MTIRETLASAIPGHGIHHRGQLSLMVLSLLERE